MSILTTIGNELNKIRQAVSPLDESYVSAHYVGTDVIELTTKRGELLEACLTVGFFDCAISEDGAKKNIKVPLGPLKGLSPEWGQICRVGYVLREGDKELRGYISLADIN